MLKSILNKFTKNKKNILFTLMWLVIIILAIFLYGQSSQKEGNKARAISVKVVRVEEKEVIEKDVYENEIELIYDMIGFNDPETGEYKELTLSHLTEDYKIRKGDRIFVYKEDSGYSYKDLDRRFYLFLLVLIFVLASIVVGGMLGAKSLISLALSFFILICEVIPLLQQGYNPIWVIFLSGVLILAISIFLLYGIRKVSFVALAGTTIGLVLSLALSILFTHLLRLTGIYDEFGTYLMSAPNLAFSMRDLLLASFIFGMLGVIDDVSVSQVIAVEELYKVKKHLSLKEAYLSAIRIGRSHIASMINTLFMAYFAVSLPIVLTFVMNEYDFVEVVNREYFAAEIARTFIGSIGLIISVPITTFLACLLLQGKENGQKESLAL